MSCGSKFQRRAAERLKALLPMVARRVVGTERWTEEADLSGGRGWRCGGVRTDRRGKVMEGVERKQEDFEVYAEFDRRPVELLLNRSDVVNRGGSGDDPSSRVLKQLKFIEVFVR